MSRSVVKLASTLVIHSAVRVPTHCGVCAMWDIKSIATSFGQWEDACGPDNYIGICDTCRMSGFTYIGTLEEFKACQLRAMNLAEYEIYANDKRTFYKCSSRPDACVRIRMMIKRGISVDAIYQRSTSNGRLRKLDKLDQARIVIEAMEG